MYGLRKVEVVPLIISATGIISRCLESYNNRLGLRSGTFLEMQKAVVLNICHIVRNFMDLPEEAPLKL